MRDPRRGIVGPPEDTFAAGGRGFGENILFAWGTFTPRGGNRRIDFVLPFDNECFQVICANEIESIDSTGFTLDSPANNQIIRYLAIGH